MKSNREMYFELWRNLFALLGLAATVPGLINLLKWSL